jgi:hypothetical protein
LVQIVDTRLRVIDGVRNVRVKPTTGSVLVHFDHARITHSMLINKLSMLGILKGVIGFPRPMRRHPLMTQRPKSREPSALVEFLNSELGRKLIARTMKACLPLVLERIVGKTNAKIIAAVL